MTMSHKLQTKRFVSAPKVLLSSKGTNRRVCNFKSLKSLLEGSPAGPTTHSIERRHFLETAKYPALGGLFASRLVLRGDRFRLVGNFARSVSGPKNPVPRCRLPNLLLNTREAGDLCDWSLRMVRTTPKVRAAVPGGTTPEAIRAIA
jgi:hypothetical protein